MKRFISKYKRWFGYLLFAFILTVALLYYRFPSDVLEHYLQTTANRAKPPLSLSVDHIEPRFPIGLKLVQTEVALKDVPDRVIFSADSLLLKPNLWSLFRGKSEYSFHCVTYNGYVVGSVYFKKDRTRGLIDTKIELGNIRVGDYTYLSDVIGHRVEGNLDGTISYTGPYNFPIGGSGEANLRLSEGRVELLQPLLTLESIDFKEMKIEMVLKNRKINITNLELKGQLLQGTLSGTITLRSKLASSSLDLRGTIEPFAEFFKSTSGIRDTVKFFKQRLSRGTLSFVIRGTLGDPIIKFT